MEPVGDCHIGEIIEEPAPLHAFMVHLAVDANVTQQITLRLRRALPPFIADFFAVSILDGPDVFVGIRASGDSVMPDGEQEAGGARQPHA